MRTTPAGFLRSRSGLSAIAAVLSASVLTSPAMAASANAVCRWVPSWAASQMRADGDSRVPDHALDNATLRQIVRISAPGQRIRVRLSNVFGGSALTVDASSLALSADQASARLVGGTEHTLTFGGLGGITIPQGAEAISDPVALPAERFADLAISLHYQQTPAQQTSHPGSRATSWIAPGDQTAAADIPGATRIEHWFNLAGIEVEQCGKAQAPVVVALGDSITDGHGVPIDSNARWTDVLARRLGGRVAVLNEGIGGNRILADGLGPNVLSRLDRDVLALPGVSAVILLEGVNDIGVLSRNPDATPDDHAHLVVQLKQAYAQIVARAHARGIRVYGGTVMPFAGSGYYHATPASEGDRQAINAWIRTSGLFDGVIDFDRVMRDPARPSYLAARLDSGDGLHPGPAGYAAMADAVNADLFK